MKDIRNFILEKKAVNFGSAKSNYGQCVILAGGPGSGKGFIKDNKFIINSLNKLPLQQKSKKSQEKFGQFRKKAYLCTR